MELCDFVDKDAEIALLSAMMIDNDSIPKVIDKLEPNDFYNTKLRKIYTAIVTCFAKSQPVDVITLADQLKKDGFLEDIGGNYKLLQINEFIPSSANIEHHHKIVIDFSKRRKLFTILRKEKIEPGDDVDDKILDIQSKLVKLTLVNDNHDIDFADEIDKADKLLKKRLEKDQKEIIGYRWSSNNLTKITGGIETPYVYVIGGLKKTGKSKFLIDQIHCLYRQNVPTLFLSLEMGKAMVTRWIWSRFAEVDSMKIRYPIDQNKRSMFSSEELYQLSQAKKEIEKLNDLLITCTKSFMDFNQIKAKIYQAIQSIGIKVVFLDHLQRCNFGYNGRSNDAKVIEEFVFRLADIVKEYNVSLVMLSQLSNVAENKKATIKDLKHSGGIGEGVDFIGIMNRLSRIDEKYKDSKDLLLDIWQRDGSDGRVNLIPDLTIGKFIDKN